MVKRPADYGGDAVEAARSVLLELTHLLGEYREHIVLVGGWVPALLLPQEPLAHVGSLDVDLALNHRSLPESGYRTIQELLESRGYVQGRQPYIYHRTVTVQGREIRVEVDLLAGEYQGTGASHRHQHTQDTLARKARGCDLAFEMSEEVRIEGCLPGGGSDTATVSVASVVPFLVMKGIALADRLKEKDAYDVYLCLTNYPGGVEALREALRPHLGHGLVHEGLEKLAEKFASPVQVGPRFVADFLGVEDEEARAIIERDAYERVQALLR